MVPPSVLKSTSGAVVLPSLHLALAVNCRLLPAATVSTVVVKPSNWTPGVEAIGTVNAVRGVDLTVETAGIVKQILFHEQVDQAEEVIDQLLVGDPPQPRAVVRLLARIVVEDRPEPRRECVERQGITAVGRGDAGDQDQGGALPEDAVGHPVSGTVPGTDPGVAVVPGHRGPEVGGSRAGGAGHCTTGVGGGFGLDLRHG